ncbi:hypothetical protein BJ741DRAFT_117677 [Chytriomyces cf. hyalinus JEL632]|nr:hypothetical protein BJ741DRAFT_117677 [Chytriomyces cf. hyalinus JEL632]
MPYYSQFFHVPSSAWRSAPLAGPSAYTPATMACNNMQPVFSRCQPVKRVGPCRLTPSHSRTDFNTGSLHLILASSKRMVSLSCPLLPSNPLSKWRCNCILKSSGQIFQPGIKASEGVCCSVFCSTLFNRNRCHIASANLWNEGITEQHLFGRLPQWVGKMQTDSLFDWDNLLVQPGFITVTATIEAAFSTRRTIWIRAEFLFAKKFIHAAFQFPMKRAPQIPAQTPRIFSKSVFASAKDAVILSNSNHQRKVNFPPARISNLLSKIGRYYESDDGDDIMLAPKRTECPPVFSLFFFFVFLIVEVFFISDLYFILSSFELNNK